MSSGPPLVSVVIPCFNSARWLPATLDSVLAQTWPRVEIIVVDDGSRDDSLAVARRYASRGVRVESIANSGAAAARNHGLALARGDYLQFLDADDLLAPDKLEKQLA
ncbi:MAG: glycosyltransferase family A protein, partial [Verrucomicrobia bacterium]|nr:glycosyltransferase family A protein [Verrucomicrobiota bacterium]